MHSSGDEACVSAPADDDAASWPAPEDKQANVPFYELTHVNDADLLRGLVRLSHCGRVNDANLIAHIAEVDRRRLYAPAGCTSMHVYCVSRLGLSDDAAYKRIQAARAARKFPVLFEAVRDGRLHLTAICMLAPHLKPENVDELVAAATRRRNFEIRAYLVQRFPEIDLRAHSPVLRPIASVIAGPTPLENMPLLSTGSGGTSAPELAPEQVNVQKMQRGVPDSTSPTPPGTEPEPAPSTIPPTPLPAAEPRFLLRLTIEKSTHDKLREAQALLGHAIPSGDLEKVLAHALDALLEKCRRRKAGAATRPASRRRSAMARRTVPAHVRRAVWARDDGQCTFIGPDGIRCGSRRRLEFDHVTPVARGGDAATADDVRLRCRTHNQYEAELMFGREFMEAKRRDRRVRGTTVKASGDPGP